MLAGNDTITLGKEDTERAHELEMLREEAEERGWGERLRVLGVGLVSRCEIPGPFLVGEFLGVLWLVLACCFSCNIALPFLLLFYSLCCLGLLVLVLVLDWLGKLKGKLTEFGVTDA